MITISVFHNEFYVAKFPVSINFAAEKICVGATHTHISPLILLGRWLFIGSQYTYFFSQLTKVSTLFDVWKIVHSSCHYTHNIITCV